MNEIVYQVKRYVEWNNLLELDVPGLPHESDLGIFKTASAANSFIEERINKDLVNVLDAGDWAWIDARPAEPIEIGDPVDEEEFFAKGVLVYYRNTGDVDRTNYHIVTRIVKELA